MKCRALDASGNWTFGAGLNNYKTGNLQIEQDIQTRMLCFVADCFFDMTAGINWYGFLSGKDPLGLRLALSALLLNTPGVTGILTLNFNLTQDRIFSVTYQVQTSYSITGGSFIYDLGGMINA